MSAVLSSRCRACDVVFDASDAPLRCPSCEALVAPHPHSSPFARLGLPLRYGHPLAAIEQAWLQRSRQVHPDRFVKKADAERRAAAEQSAAVNDAWRTLRDPFSRAVWLLHDRGVVEPKLPPTRLMALMEAREEAEDSAAGKVRVVAQTATTFAAQLAVVEKRLLAIDEIGWLELTPSSSSELNGIAAQLAELRTLARLSADLGGPVLIASLEGR